MTDELRISAGGFTQTFRAPGPVVLGRNPGGAAIVIAHQAVSGQHAHLIHDGRSWLLADLGSTNGTWVNGRALAEPMPIDGSVTVRLGKPDYGADVLLEANAASAPQGAPTELATPPMAPLPTPPPPPGPPRPVVAATVLGTPGPALRSGPALMATLGARTVTLAALPGRTYRIGRDPNSDVISDEPTVSREQLWLGWNATQWEMTDVSARGTFGADGKALPRNRAVPLATSTTLRLGDATSGEALALTLSGGAAQQSTRQWWRRRVALVAAAVAVVLIAAGTALVVTRHEKQAGLDLAAVKRSVVHLTITDPKGKVLGFGSGTIISSDGTILTNAHVGNPKAPGQAAQYGIDAAADTQDAIGPLIVGITTKPDDPAKDQYLAKTVVSDGYVDVSVLKIYAKADGSPLTGALKLPALPIGDSRKVKVGDGLTVLGFPGASDSDSITVTKGHVSAYVRDPHMHSERAFFESTAEIRHGNSGGAAVNDRGQLIGIPTRLSEHGGDLSERARPVEWAKAVIALAKTGAAPNYLSPFLVALTGAEKGTLLGATTSQPTTCSDGDQTHLASNPAQLFATFSVSGVRAGQDLYATLYRLDSAGDPEVRMPTTIGDPYLATGEHDCPFLKYPDSLQDGRYLAVLWAGPDAEKAIGQGEITVGGA